MDFELIIQEESNKEYYQNLQMFLNYEYKTKTIYPPRHLIYRALELTPFDNVKVCMLFMDPYHGGQANGIAVSIDEGIKVPSTLRNLLKELKSDLNIDHSSNLTGWCNEGVLLLNTILTVQEKKPLSHSCQGWERLTDRFITELSTRSGVCFMLFGNTAQKKEAFIDSTKNCIIKTSHPCGLSAYRTVTPFIGSKCFSRANDYLISRNKEPVNWSI